VQKIAKTIFAQENKKPFIFCAEMWSLPHFLHPKNDFHSFL